MSNNNRKGLKLAAQLNIDIQYAVKLAANYFNQEANEGNNECTELKVICKDLIDTAECMLAILPKEQEVKCSKN